MSPAPLPSWWAEQLHPRWHVAAEAVAEAFAAAVVVSIAVAVVASIAAVEVMAEVMASMVRPWLVRVAGGTPTACASAGGNPGSITLKARSKQNSSAPDNPVRFFF
jgi:hypothetical protein